MTFWHGEYGDPVKNVKPFGLVPVGYFGEVPTLTPTKPIEKLRVRVKAVYAPTPNGNENQER